MKYYIHGPEKTTGPYTTKELREVCKAFPLKPLSLILTEDEYKMAKALEELN